MEAKQVTEVKQNGKEMFWLRDRWLIIHKCVDKNEEWKDTFLVMGSLWKSSVVLDPNKNNLTPKIS